MSANFLNRQALPSITGLPASGPMLPRPSTAVPLVTTATRLPRAVYSHASSEFDAISWHGSATPGEYASDKSRWVTSGLLETTSIFPGRPARWYSSASFFRIIPFGTLTGFQTSRDGLPRASSCVVLLGTLKGFRTSRDGLARAKLVLP